MTRSRGFVRVRVEAPGDALLFRFHARVQPVAEMVERHGSAAVYSLPGDRCEWFRSHADDLGVAVVHHST